MEHAASLPAAASNAQGLKGAGVTVTIHGGAVRAWEPSVRSGRAEESGGWRFKTSLAYTARHNPKH